MAAADHLSCRLDDPAMAQDEIEPCGIDLAQQQETLPRRRMLPVEHRQAGIGVGAEIEPVPQQADCAMLGRWPDPQRANLRMAQARRLRSVGDLQKQRLRQVAACQGLVPQRAGLVRLADDGAMPGEEKHKRVLLMRPSSCGRRAAKASAGKDAGGGVLA